MSSPWGNLATSIWHYVASSGSRLFDNATGSTQEPLWNSEAFAKIVLHASLPWLVNLIRDERDAIYDMREASQG